MKYEILHGDAFPVVQCDLQYGESIKAESDAMIAMSASLELTGNMDRNILGGLARRFLAGESFSSRPSRPAGAGPGPAGPRRPRRHHRRGAGRQLRPAGAEGRLLASTPGVEVDHSGAESGPGSFLTGGPLCAEPPGPRPGLPQQLRRHPLRQPGGGGGGHYRQRPSGGLAGLYAVTDREGVQRLDLQRDLRECLVCRLQGRGSS